MPNSLALHCKENANKPIFKPEYPGFLAIDADAPQTPPKGLRVASQAVVKFMQKQGARPVQLEAAGIVFYSPTSVHARSDDVAYYNHTYSWTEGDTFRAPIVCIEYDASKRHNKRYIRKLNSSLRHELGHTLQERQTPMYNNSSVITRVRMGAAALCMTAIDSCTAIAQETAQEIARNSADLPYWGAGILALGGVASLLLNRKATKRLLHYVEPREWGAEYFALKHRKFNPISLTETE